jgi:hypothetical protein
MHAADCCACSGYAIYTVVVAVVVKICFLSEIAT